jgi:hypothetical protein
MLGYDAGLRDVVALLDHTRDTGPVRSIAGRKTPSP